MKATSSTPRARALAAGLREVREAHGVGLRQLARILGFAPQVLSLWEKGLRLPTVADVALILGFFEVRGEKQKYLLELAGSAREPDWVTANLPSLSHCEQGATRLTNWEIGIVPGLLQTADYARAIFESSNLSVNQVDARVVARMDRQKMLTAPDPVTLHAILDERVLASTVGNEDIMSDQMDRLLETSRLPHVSVRVLPATAGFHPGRVGSFMLMEYAAGPPIVLLEHHRCSVFLSAADKVTSFRKLAKVVTEAAMSEDHSRERIAEAAR
ncbi:helix-turn-helix transcriptional regulator [Amycolatopsis sp. OK19-0408]|uniref:Helix-turn-helix transcriptional regulator n=1 Tax=Amycolatopsis iheyensis TaxID=2945988 RepID=A0A9X2NAA1_9PSEU|nr:helix-turn-helix transcriptional regulator [Amycolatopsis iheyensis]MCR6483410.1 helix-turn-helix transcriptional regulator [Amycolatopsis iheyensis]